MIKNIAKILLVLLFLLITVNPIFAQEQKANIYFFWGEGCPHCEREKPFLETLEEQYTGVKVYDFEVWHNADNRKLMIEVGQKLNTNINGVPFTVVGEEYFVGWLDEQTTGTAIENAVQDFLENDGHDLVGEILTASLQPTETKETQRESENQTRSAVLEEIDLPIVGKIDTSNLSLPILTIILGGLDGFNPCAMWTLIFLIGLLLGMENKKRRWILGITFIVASAFVYFLFMAAWLNLLLFVGFIIWVRALIGLLALVGGGYNLKEFFVNKDDGCKVTGNEKRQAVFEKLKNITHRKQFLLAMGGIILLAFAVNLVELICSAGLPVVFTQILVLSNLAPWQHYAYMLLYIFIFMLDDLLIFFMAMFTLKMTGISTKYSRFSHLVGGLLMLIIGLLLIFKPELLMFG
ncbi:MAG: hypothetical protein A2383_02540 [Candidatus Pacebacteria bacterium RIFOXYB1_FULL_39_46]|nr:MAG: hypothetical protein A2383_02540 [Candidatus Pacebacteria bacterium RIFOXYB1_FULL_39_46]OGJ39265.1 MAG: hypothetical protein A2182_02805 [Candidatus Pacebacteria bacterium RIFOXYA1_FULL_38_18]OGJ40944.1 MAG: hypothetical protein A2582_01470 [Candidatus Pacebacteria bacterium RIFOXYD1_FULL_39_27]OGJ41126.1 MAG: hypothetical protein A2411_01385 [Candidatus Pacebacteria bacterium RIFOXYC1_FULL_39_21]